MIIFRLLTSCLFLFMAAAATLMASAPSHGEAKDVEDVDHGVSETVLDHHIDPIIHLSIQKLRQSNSTGIDALLARFDVEYTKLNHATIQSIQLVWKTPSGQETRIHPKPVESEVYAIRIKPQLEDGFHELRSLIVLEEPKHEGANIRVIEQKYTLEFPQLILTKDWEMEMQPPAGDHGVLSGDDLAELGHGEEVVKKETESKPSIVSSIMLFVFINVVLMGGFMGYQKFGKGLPKKVLNWLEGCVPASRSEALLAMAGVGVMMPDAMIKQDEPVRELGESEVAGLDENDLMDLESDQHESKGNRGEEGKQEIESSPEEDKADKDKAKMKKSGKDPMESTQFLTESQAALRGPDDKVEDEDFNLDDLSF